MDFLFGLRDYLVEFFFYTFSGFLFFLFLILLVIIWINNIKNKEKKITKEKKIYSLYLKAIGEDEYFKALKYYIVNSIYIDNIDDTTFIIKMIRDYYKNKEEKI